MELSCLETLLSLKLESIREEIILLVLVCVRLTLLNVSESKVLDAAKKEIIFFQIEKSIAEHISFAQNLHHNNL